MVQHVINGKGVVVTGMSIGAIRNPFQKNVKIKRLAREATNMNCVKVCASFKKIDVPNLYFFLMNSN